MKNFILNLFNKIIKEYKNPQNKNDIINNYDHLIKLSKLFINKKILKVSYDKNVQKLINQNYYQ